MCSVSSKRPSGAGVICPSCYPEAGASQRGEAFPSSMLSGGHKVSPGFSASSALSFLSSCLLLNPGVPGRLGSEEAGTPLDGWGGTQSCWSFRGRSSDTSLVLTSLPAVQIHGSGVGEETPCKSCAPVSSLTHREVTRAGCDWPHLREGVAGLGAESGPLIPGRAPRSSSCHLPLPPFAALIASSSPRGHLLQP